MASATVAIRRAEPVQAQRQEAGGLMQQGASLVPAAIGLVAGVMQMNQQMRALDGDCIPTTAEITFVNDMIREQARAGKDFSNFWGSGRHPCGSGFGGDGGVGRVAGTETNYRTAAELAMGTELSACFDVWAGAADRGMIWYGAPRTSMERVCRRGTGPNCGPNDLVTVSNIYEIFLLVDFGPADYLPREAAIAARLLEKNDRCSPVRLNARKRELWGGFLVQTAGGLGQRQDAGNVMEMVGNIMQQGGGNTGQTVMGLAPALMQNMMR